MTDEASAEQTVPVDSPPPQRKDTRFPPGVSGNPSGRPKGSFSVREAWRRKLRKGWQSDTEAGEGEAPIGKLARDIADLLLNAIERGDAEAVRTIATAIAEAEGKPQERVEHSGTVKRVSIQLEDTPEDPGDVEELL